VAEVLEQDMTIENGKVTSYRVKLNVSFKYVPEASPARKSAAKKKR
jgi:flavin-binding protein dodecin